MAIDVAFFSTDFTQEPVVDEEKSQIAQRQVLVPHTKRLSFGGTFKTRGAMPATELNKHDYDNHLAWQFQIAPDGHIQTVDVQGNLHDPSWIWQQRWMHRDGAEQFQRARATGQKIISDLDDDFWSLSKTNVAYTTTDPLRNPDFNRDHYWNNLAASDLITVSTEALAKRVEKLGVPTVIVRNAIDLAEWEPNDPSSDEGCVGWVGGVQWRSHDLAQLRCANIGQFLEDHHLRFYHGGDSQHQSAPDVQRQMAAHDAWIESLPNNMQSAFRSVRPQMPDTTVPRAYEQAGIDPYRVQCVVAPLCPIWEYPGLWKPLNVSLIPLERVPFNFSKSWLKSLESCAAGVPYIVSAKVPEQELLIDEGTAGREARNDKPQQWIDHLYDLLDPDVRAEEGKINRSIAERHHIGDRWADWDQAFEVLR